MSEIKSVLIVDCGKTATTAILIEEVEGVFSLTARGEATSSVDEPHSDVTVGVALAIAQIEETTGHRLLRDGHRGVITPRTPDAGVDAFLCTSSTGGGLQMMVAGLVRIMTAESAERAALGAGAMVMDVMAIDDGRLPPERIQRMRDQRPDIILLSGGVDGGNIDEVLALAEQIAAAKLRDDLPVIYAGNIAARERVAQVLDDKARLFFVENVRPVLEQEVLEPAGAEIHQRFMEHVISNAPGYKTLAGWATKPILPTAAALGYIVENTAEGTGTDILAVNLGEAITDVLSGVKGRFTRTVSGDLGLGSSVGSLLRQAGIANITRWLPFDLDEDYVRNTLRNKMLHPYTLPATLVDLHLEHAVAREIIRLSLQQHRSSVVGLRGIQRKRDIANTFEQVNSGESLLDLMSLRTIIGIGPVFSQAPRLSQSLLILLDALEPLGVTDLYLDKLCTAAHLGALSTELPEVSRDIFLKDSLLHLGTVIAPVGGMNLGETAVDVAVESPDGSFRSDSVCFGSIKIVPLNSGLSRVVAQPSAGLDLGKGKGKAIKGEFSAGRCGLIIDARGRHLNLPVAGSDRQQLIRLWHEALDAYPNTERGVL